MSQLDDLDRAGAAAFESYVVRKDLAQRFRGQYPVPTYVGEFLLGRYCATTDEAEIADGLEQVQRIMEERTVHAGQHELFKSHARERGSVRLIDLVTARLDSRFDRYFVTLPSLQLTDVRVDDALVRQNDRMLTGGFYAEVQLEYDAAEAFKFGITNLRPIQMSTHDAASILADGRAHFERDGWKRFLLRSVGFEADLLNPRQHDILLMRMVPFAVHNYNLVEIGPRGTGKSHLFQQVSPYAHLVSGGKATVAQHVREQRERSAWARLPVRRRVLRRGIGRRLRSKGRRQHHEGLHGVGRVHRGRESIRAEGSIVLVGNFDVDMREQLRQGHLFKPMPSEMRDDTAFMDRIHAYLPGWDVPKLHPGLFTEHFGLVSDFLSECWRQLRHQSRLENMRTRVVYGSALSGRDRRAVDLTVDGLLKLVSPDPEAEIAPDDLQWAVALAMECRRRVKEQQKRVGREEFDATDFSYSLEGGASVYVSVPEGAPGPADGPGHEARAPSPTPSAAPAAQAPARKSDRPRAHKDTYVAGEKIGSFTVVAPLGKGGFSSVYRVHRPIDDREYTLKVFIPRESFDLVKREVDFLQTVDHPNVVKVVWADQTPDGRWYLVTELIEGNSLESNAYDGELLSIPEVIDIGRSLLSALVAIHPDADRLRALRSLSDHTPEQFDEIQELEHSGVVHRDVKPQNLIRARDGRIVLIDFNIASRAGDAVMTMSGTPPYQAPDIDYTQWDPSTDLFAAGVTLYELASQHHPYENDTPSVHGEPRDPRQFRSDLPAPLARFLVRACAPMRTERFVTAQEMLSALDAAAASSF